MDQTNGVAQSAGKRVVLLNSCSHRDRYGGGNISQSGSRSTVRSYPIHANFVVRGARFANAKGLARTPFSQATVNMTRLRKHG
jgi:hypothetical protein